MPRHDLDLKVDLMHFQQPPLAVERPDDLRLADDLTSRYEEDARWGASASRPSVLKLFDRLFIGETFPRARRQSCRAYTEGQPADDHGHRGKPAHVRSPSAEKYTVRGTRAGEQDPRGPQADAPPGSPPASSRFSALQLRRSLSRKFGVDDPYDAASLDHPEVDIGLKRLQGRSPRCASRSRHGGLRLRAE